MERDRIIRLIAYIICLAVLPSGFAFGYANMDIMPDDQFIAYSGAKLIGQAGRNPASLRIDQDAIADVEPSDGLDTVEIKQLYADLKVLIALSPREVAKLNKEGQRQRATLKANAICENFMRNTYGTGGHASKFTHSPMQISGGDARKFDIIHCGSGPQRQVAAAEVIADEADGYEYGETYGDWGEH